VGRINLVPAIVCANCPVVFLDSSDINRHPLASCDIHRIIDNKFASSTFTKHVCIPCSLIHANIELLHFLQAYDETGETALPRSSKLLASFAIHLLTVILSNSPLASQNGEESSLCPQLNNPATEHRQLFRTCQNNCSISGMANMSKSRDVTFDAQIHGMQNRNIVSSFISSVIQSFLIRHGFASQQAAEGKSPTKDGSPSPHKRRRITADVSSINSSEPDQAKFPNDAVILPPPQPLYISPVRISVHFSDLCS
jgi:DNA mismatch repair protein MLH3